MPLMMGTHTDLRAPPTRLVTSTVAQLPLLLLGLIPSAVLAS